MKDSDLLNAVDEYISNNSTTISELFDQAGIARANYSRWKAGRPISPKMKNRLIVAVMPDVVTNQNKSFCYLDKCPATPPPDRQLQIILETWNDLTLQQRGDLSTRTLEMRAENQEKKEEQCSGFESSNCKVG